MIYGEKIRFRLMEQTEFDTNLVLRWRNNKGMHHHYFNSDPLTKYGHQKFLEKSIAAGDKNFIVEMENKDGTWIPVGVVAVLHINYISRNAEWGRFIVSPDYSGLGIGRKIENLIMSYVFDTLNMNKLWCEVINNNQRVIDQHERSGFIVEGIKRKHLFKEGKYHDVVFMGMLKNEWEAKNAKQ